MKPIQRLFAVSVVSLNFAVFLCHGQPVANQAVSRVDLKTVPDGNYLVTLEIGGQPQRLNLQVQGNRAKCVNSTDSKLKSIQGKLEQRGSGVFIAMLQGEGFRSTQIWIFRTDGTAAIREVPDRGEQQSAVPVEGVSIESPTK